MINNAAQTLCQDQSLKIRDDCLPLVVVGVGKSLERKLGWKESIVWGDSIVVQNGKRREHIPVELARSYSQRQERKGDFVLSRRKEYTDLV